MKYFVLATDPVTPEQEKAIKEVVGKGPRGWWHWLPNFWLVTDTNDELTAAALRDQLFEINKTTRCVVLEVRPRMWAALTRPDSQGRSMTDWFTTNWPPDVE